jgi:glycosyltransferase involved in cell wall biosynthesis
MSSKERIGVGIVTYNRPHLLQKLLNSLNYCNFVDLIIVNDGDHIDNLEGWNYYLVNNPTNLGVGKSKNVALRHLLDKGCDHIFLIEDDIFIKDETVFHKYIEASKVSGIQHFNFSQHGVMNKIYSLDGVTPNPRLVVDYKSCKVSLYPHCVGAFSYYSKKCLDKIGLLDERFFNAKEHLDHTYEIIKADMHPPFWWFADIDKSWEYLGDEEWSVMQSTIMSNPNHSDIITQSDKVFINKHGLVPLQIPDTSVESVGAYIKNIKRTYSIQ